MSRAGATRLRARRHRVAQGASGPALLIGMGNRYRSDDRAGLEVAEALRDVVPADIEVITIDGEPTALLDIWRGARGVVLVDCVSSGAPAGTLHRFAADEAPLPARVFRASTHALSVAEAIEIARALGELPCKLTVIGIEGRRFAAGERMSAEVRRAIAGAVSAARDELARLVTRPALGRNAPGGRRRA